MRLRTDYLTWIKERWLKRFLLGHMKDIYEGTLKLIISFLALIIAIPYLLIEGIIRLYLKILNKYHVVNTNNQKQTKEAKDGK